MGEKHCDTCKWYDMDFEYCTAYHEKHYMSDGENCPGWKDWEEQED